MVKSQDAFHIHLVESIVVGYVTIINWCLELGAWKEHPHVFYLEKVGMNVTCVRKISTSPLTCHSGFSRIWFPSRLHLNGIFVDTWGHTCKPDVDSEWPWGRFSDNYWKALWFCLMKAFFVCLFKWCRISCIRLSVSDGSAGSLSSSTVWHCQEGIQVTAWEK